MQLDERSLRVTNFSVSNVRQYPWILKAFCLLLEIIIFQKGLHLSGS